MDLAGAFIWSVEMDDFNGHCGGPKYPLLRSVYEVFTDNISASLVTSSQMAGSGIRSLPAQHSDSKFSQISQSGHSSSSGHASSSSIGTQNGEDHKDFSYVASHGQSTAGKSDSTEHESSDSNLGENEIYENSWDTKSWHEDSLTGEHTSLGEDGKFFSFFIYKYFPNKQSNH